MNTLYVNFEEVRNVFKCFIKYEESVNETMDNLSTIDLSVIDEMIEEKEKEYEGIPEARYKIGYVIALKELKEKLSPKN